MSPWVSALIAAITGLATSIALAGSKHYLASRRVFDIPNHRSSHSRPTLRGAGLGIVIGLLLGLTSSVPIIPSATHELTRLAITAQMTGSIAFVGFMEDLHGLRIRKRVACQVLIFGLTAYVLTLTGDLPGHMALLAWIGGVFYVNAANFMDGANGISSLHGGLVGWHYALMGALGGGAGLTAAGIVVSVAFLSFLPWNIGRSRVFMGDTGSYTLGAVAWSLALWALSLGVSPVAVLAPLIVYSADVSLTLAKRMARRAPLHEAHHEHTYQQLMTHFRSHAIPTGITTAATAGCAGLGVWALIAPGSTPWTLGGIVLVALAYLVSPTVLPLANRSPRKGWMDESA